MVDLITFFASKPKKSLTKQRRVSFVVYLASEALF